MCKDFPGQYWRELDRERAYPTAFVKALTDAGFSIEATLEKQMKLDSGLADVVILSRE